MGGGETTIIYELDTAFVMTKQHDHAILANLIAEQWKEDYPLKKEVLFAIEQHDRAWMDIDWSPIWNDVASAPYSFIDYPLSIKLPFYVKGINEVEEVSTYAALLCSTHYTKFFHDGGMNHDLIYGFVQEERQRQRTLLQKLKETNKFDEKAFEYHYKLLKFCDTLSLFICMQEAGVKGEQLHIWFRKGIEQPDKSKCQTTWINKNTIEIDPFPFYKSFDVAIPMRVVSKERIKKIGIIEAFLQASPIIRYVKIT